MKRNGRWFYSWQFLFACVLILISFGLYGLHYFLFHDLHHILLYGLHELAFIPLEVLLVTLFLHRVLEHREKRAMLKKLNMVIGVFFSEVGRELISLLSIYDLDSAKIKSKLLMIDQWDKQKLANVTHWIDDQTFEMSMAPKNLKEFKTLLIEKRGFLLSLLENPNLLEHDSFTDLLWAVFHLTEELEYRKKLPTKKEDDFNHLIGDLLRVYPLILKEWVQYVAHLQKDYPYLYSLSMRLSPFDSESSIKINS